ncbi:MAG: hypothetical protein ACRCVN_02505 [Spirochaetia bacterium]
MDHWKNKISAWISEIKTHPRRKQGVLFFLIIAICAIPFILTFFRVFAGLFAILAAIGFVLLTLMFLSPSIFKLLVQKGILHTKKSLIIDRTLYTQIQATQDPYPLFKIEQIPSAINIKTFQCEMDIQEHDEPLIEIVLHQESKSGALSFFTDYDDVTSTMTIDQGPTSKNTKPVRYSMTLFIPKGTIIRTLTARVVDGTIAIKMKGAQPVETLDLDMVNSTLHLENLIIPILKINGLNLTLTSQKLFSRYLYINAAGSQFNLHFNDIASQSYSGKMKCHAVLSTLCVNNLTVPKISGNNLQNIWGTEGTSRSIMLSLNILRTNVKISTN